MAQSSGDLVCPPVDVVFTVDTSGSMDDEAQALCNSISSVQSELLGLGLVSKTFLLGITNTGGSDFPCLTDDVENMLGDSVPGNGGACGTILDDSESWGEAISIVASRFPWTPDAVRVIVPISDEGACDGDSCDDPGEDRDAINNAITLALANNVFVSPISGTGSSQCVITLGQDIATATGGTAFVSTDPSLDLAGAVRDLIIDACVKSEVPPTKVNCEEKDVTDVLLSLDGNALKQKRTVRRLARILNKAGGKKRDVRSLRKEADALYLSAWTSTWSYPSKTISCEESLECTSIDISSSVNEVLTEGSGFVALAKKAQKLINKTSAKGIKRRVRKLVKKAEKLLQDAQTDANTLPASQTTCSTKVEMVF
ncbi:MAG: VWA domain-containing protein [Candidatus Dadabacteria bacterium]|nr:MAG: VWA domain-containing protein [Candidatus Dadabacteria bacterium]